MENNHLQYVPIADYSSIFGQEINNAIFEDILSKIGCQKAIAILSRFMSLHIGICNGNPDAVRLDWQLRVLHANHVSGAGGDWLQYNQFRTIMSPQSILNLEKWVLKFCPVEYELSPVTPPDLMLVMDALLAINDMLPKTDVVGHETEYLYLTLYHNTHKTIKDQIARSFYVFSTLAKTNSETADFLNSYAQKRGF